MRDRTLNPRTLALALAADVCFGDPTWFPHPVRAIGWCASRGASLAQRIAKGSPVRERTAGFVITVSIVGGAAIVSAAAMRYAATRDANLQALCEIGFAWTTLALRDLLSESRSVREALQRNDLALARQRLARIVGRDTAGLTRAQIARATIETLAESLGDGIVGPLVALSVGGIPMAFAFKAANTLDSMLGHREAPYTHLGFAPAKLDDVLCYIPSRFAAFAICLASPIAGGDVSRAIHTLRRDGRRHASPNAGNGEAAMAGALGVRLGGTNCYDGVLLEAPHLGAEFVAPQLADVVRAERIVVAATLICACLCMVARAGTFRT